MQTPNFLVLLRVDDPLCPEGGVGQAVLSLAPAQARRMARAIDQFTALVRADSEFHHIVLRSDLPDWYAGSTVGQSTDAITREPVEDALAGGYAVLDRYELDSSALVRVECATLQIHPDDVCWDAIPRNGDRHVRTWGLPHEVVRAFALEDIGEVRKHLHSLHPVCAPKLANDDRDT